MNKQQNYLPKGWQWAKLGDGQIATVVMGQSPPGTTYNEQGQGLPFYQGKADFGDVSPTPRVWCSAPKKTAEPGDILLSVRAPVGPTNLASHRCCIGRGLAAIRGERNALTLYLYFWFKHIEPWLSEQGQGSTFKAIGKDILENIIVPLPPLPVQERIVEILQKADEIRRKRKEALELAEKILPALFLEMFGDPATNPKGWETEPIGSLVHFDTALIKPEPGKTYLYLAPEHIESNTGNYTGPHPTDGREIGSAKYSFTSDHVLYCKLRPYLNKVVLPHTSGICSTELVPLRPGPKLLREFLAIYLRLPFFVATAVQKSQGTKMPRFGPELMKQERIIVPPIPLQRSFCLQASQLMEASRKLKEGLSLSSSCFDGLLSRAFTGELTAEWEAANADWIAERQAFYERLPRLVVLALIAEKAKQTGRAAAVLVTALMKYVFLLQMEGNADRRRFYHFVPYHYGPFAKELYDDLATLQAEGLVRVENDAEEEKTKITLADPAKAEEALSALPDDLKEAAAGIIETYGDLDHNALLETVYEKYPSYARKSRLRKRGKRS
ncbi:restriction modification system DNA specificity domain-containing protein [Spirochaeta thermophila DSM 6578]|uniref:Restriction modification system DNA specificity domain-containing protein n=1 Tax=Winmispira thermophila (strain ATCC 700085 / DSM 6578 / Z-1203) TaxID=869211 RepID=G0GES6_WINT7|nr:restriction endonuclease subunit S [Spirochaeta thermophila]AEJ61482.1 restriction modification system DNA specificity domain-containing protein [Spirochaeta thermophila DSM 6578]